MLPAGEPDQPMLRGPNLTEWSDIRLTTARMAARVHLTEAANQIRVATQGLAELDRDPGRHVAALERRRAELADQAARISAAAEADQRHRHAQDRLGELHRQLDDVDRGLGDAGWWARGRRRDLTDQRDGLNAALPHAQRALRSANADRQAARQAAPPDHQWAHLLGDHQRLEQNWPQEVARATVADQRDRVALVAALARARAEHQHAEGRLADVAAETECHQRQRQSQTARPAQPATQATPRQQPPEGFTPWRQRRLGQLTDNQLAHLAAQLAGQQRRLRLPEPGDVPPSQSTRRVIGQRLALVRAEQQLRANLPPDLAAREQHGRTEAIRDAQAKPQPAPTRQHDEAYRPSAHRPPTQTRRGPTLGM